MFAHIREMNHYDETDTGEQDVGLTGSDTRNQTFAYIRNMNNVNAEDGGEANTTSYDPRSTIAPSAHYQEAAAVC